MVDVTFTSVLQHLPLLAYNAPGACSKPTPQTPVKMALQSTIPMSPDFCCRRSHLRRRSRPPRDPLLLPDDAAEDAPPDGVLPVAAHAPSWPGGRCLGAGGLAPNPPLTPVVSPPGETTKWAQWLN